MQVRGSLGGVGECGGSHSLHVPWQGWNKCQGIEEAMSQRERLNHGLAIPLISPSVVSQNCIEPKPTLKEDRLRLLLPF